MTEEPRKVYPDIVVHIRKSDDNNLLVVEAKPKRSKKVPDCDSAKLTAFTDSRGKYRYQYGLFIGFDRLNKPQMQWYVDGEQKSYSSLTDVT